MATTTITELFNPQFIESFKFPLKLDENPIIINIYRSANLDEKEVLEITNFYPFMTIQDLKTLIYIQKDNDHNFHPSYQALLIPLEIDDKNYIAADFVWMDPNGKNK